MHQLSLRPPNSPPLLAPSAKPFVKWVGGKRRVIQDIYSFMPTTWGNYHEPFVGGGALFFSLAAQRIRKPKWANISDNNIRLVRTWRAIRDSTEDLIRALKKHHKAHSKEHYYATRAMDVDAMDDVGVAAWFIYLNKTGFNEIGRAHV